VARIIVSEEVFGDLERIVDSLLGSSPESAGEALHKIRTAIEVLGLHPLLGRRVQAEIRELVISWGATGYLALYRFDAAPQIVRILRIRHQREAGYTD
jgi:plasmid stabilization system protein ParE